MLRFGWLPLWAGMINGGASNQRLVTFYMHVLIKSYFLGDNLRVKPLGDLLGVLAALTYLHAVSWSYIFCALMACMQFYAYKLSHLFSTPSAF